MDYQRLVVHDGPRAIEWTALEANFPRLECWVFYHITGARRGENSGLGMILAKAERTISDV